MSELKSNLGASIVVKPLCDQCPEITSALIHVCASTGIVRGRSTGEQLAFYMRTVHAGHDPQLASE